MPNLALLVVPVMLIPVTGLAVRRWSGRPLPPKMRYSGINGSRAKGLGMTLVLITPW